jgi:pimeloyl-ACP methyl ester carboxylesterase
MRAKLPSLEGSVDRNGVKIHYEVYGEGPDTILFVPTWSLVHSRVYKAQIPYFSEHFRCVTYDARGNGKSDRPVEVEAYSLDNFVDDALAVMDATGTESAILFGYSFSGLLCAVLAAEYPERVRAVVTVGASSPLVPPYDCRIPEAFDAKRERYEGWDKWNRHHWAENYSDFAGFFMSRIFIEPHSTKQIEDGVAWALETNGATLIKTIDARASSRFQIDEAMHRRIRCPMLVICGEDDPVVPPDASRAVAAVTGA